MPAISDRAPGGWPAVETPFKLPRALLALAHEAVVTEDSLTLQSSWEPSLPSRSIVVLAGHATHVP
jgi:hypothetical protein